MTVHSLTRLLALLLCLSLVACGGAATAPPAPAPAPTTSTIVWTTLRVTTPGAVPQVQRITSVDGTAIPTLARPNGLDLLIMGSGLGADYGNRSLTEFYDDVKPLLRDVFGSANALQSSGYKSPLQYYVTDYEYPQATPTGTGCNPGLPASWAPEKNTPVNDMPAWDCNIAVSTAHVSLNLGMIIHRQSVQDRSKYNLFSSEYNSYAAILHELSHAAFVMSDEADALGAARFGPAHDPNVYKNDGGCNGTCPGQCQKIGTTIYYRCVPSSDATNLMYFMPQPTPGVNTGWNNYQYQFGSANRLQYIYGLCQQGEC